MTKLPVNLLLSIPFFVISCANYTHKQNKLPKFFKKNYSLIHDNKEQKTYISNQLVSNLVYLEFLSTLKIDHETAYREHLPDSLNWNRHKEAGELMTKNYLRHPAFREHPVVNISHSDAIAWCNWLEEQLNKKNSSLRFEVRLPSLKELKAVHQKFNTKTLIFKHEYFEMTDGNIALSNEKATTAFEKSENHIGFRPIVSVHKILP